MAGPWEQYAQPTEGPWSRYAAPAKPERTWGQTIYENVIGSGEADTPGEKLGAAVGDVVKAGAAGVARGAGGLLGLPGSLIDLADKGMQKLGVFPEGMPGHPLSGASINRAMSAATGGATDFRGESRLGRYAGTVGEFVPGALLFGGTAALPAYAVAPGVASEAAGQATEGKKLPDWVPMVGSQDVEPWARTGAALAAPLATNALARVVTPNPARPSRLDAAKRLESEGVDVTAGQRTGNATLRTREEYIPRTAQMMDEQGDQFTRAVLRRIGVDSDRATGTVMNDALKRIGGMFDDLSAKNSIATDRNLKTAADRALSTFDDLSTTPAKAPLLTNITDKIDDALKTGAPISGEQYQAWRSRLGKVAAKSTDPALREGASELLGALDDALERTLRLTGNADDLAQYALARQQYRDYLAIERAVSAAGDATSGVVTPGALRSAIVGQGRRSYVTGARDLGELSKAGNEVFPTSHGNSGTQQRLSANLIPGAMNAGPLGALGYMMSGGDPIIAGAAGTAGLLSAPVRNSVVGSRAGQAWLGNQLLPAEFGLLNPGGAAISATLLGQQDER